MYSIKNIHGKEHNTAKGVSIAIVMLIYEKGFYGENIGFTKLIKLLKTR